MKKILLISFVLIIPHLIKAQITDSIRRKIDIELAKYRTITHIGIGLESTGGITIVVGSIFRSNAEYRGYNNHDKIVASNTIIYTGMGLSILGFILNIVAVNNIHKAGITLKYNRIIIPFK